MAHVTMPQLIVEVGFTAPLTGTALHIGDTSRGIIGTATIAPATLLTDVSAYVTSVVTRRGVTRADGPYLRYEAGSCTITFRNEDRRFDPTNLTGPYVSAGVTQVEPMRVVQVRAIWNGRAYPVWRGSADEWKVAYDGPNSSFATVTCTDALGIFAAQDRAAISAAGAGEDSGQRVSRILNALSWPVSDRVIQNGDEVVQATTLSGNALTELLLTADTELGGLWIDAAGRAIYRSRSAPYSDAWSRWSQAHFGDNEQAGVDTTINLSSNPSLETGTAGWSAIGAPAPTIARSSARARFGSWSLLATWGAGGFLPGVAYDVGGLVVGRTYTISVYVWVPTGSIDIDVIVAGQSFGWSTGGLRDQWVRLVWTGTATATTLGFGVWPAGSPVGGEQVWIDGLQVEAGIAATPYVDGDQAGCEWDGVVHTSTSRRLPELPYADTDLTSDAPSIVNLIRAARAGGTEQVASDPASISSYLTRSHTRSDLIMTSDLKARMWADQIVARSSRPELRFATLDLIPGRDPDRLWPQALGREISDRIRGTRRPPGGGAAIVRESWVRGIEHTIVVDQAWKTRFVLEHARNVLGVTDGFGRTTSNGWGNADGGIPWTVTGGANSEYATGAGVGTHTHPTANVLHSSVIELGGVNQSVSVDVTCPVVPTGAAITLWVAGRYANASNHYLGRLNIATSGAASIMLFKRVGGALSSGLGTAAAGTHSAGNTWRLQLDVLGTTVRTRSWRPGVDAMPDWQLVISDVDLSGGTGVAVMSRRETGNTNVSPTFSFDAFSAVTRGAWS